MTRKGINWDKERRLGKVTDRELARILGVTAANVHGARTRRGIPPLNPHQTYKINWDLYASKLGKQPDRVLAVLLGCSVRAVQRARTRRGIPSRYVIARYGSACMQYVSRSTLYRVKRVVSATPATLSKLHAALGADATAPTVSRRTVGRALRKLEHDGAPARDGAAMSVAVDYHWTLAFGYPECLACGVMCRAWSGWDDDALLVLHECQCGASWSLSEYTPTEEA